MAYFIFCTIVVYGVYLKLSSKALIATIKPIQTQNSFTNFSLIIPFRNESHHIVKLVDSLAKLEYPKDNFEVIFINDNSDDQGEKLLVRHISIKDNFRLININNSRPSKKSALYEGIKLSKFDWIVQTDADCIINSKWLLSFNDVVLNNKELKFITGPVLFRKNALLANLQYVESFALMAATSFGLKYNIPQMANAANMCWKKSGLTNFELDEIYKDTGMSGDDYFLMMKFGSKYDYALGYTSFKESIIITESQKDLLSFIRQRMRWVSKYSKTETLAQKLFPLGIWLFHAIVLFSGLYFLIRGQYILLVVFFLSKFFSELFYLRIISSALDKPMNVLDVLLQQLIYTPYTLFFGIGSFFNRDQWK